MRLPRLRFGLRRLIVLVAICAIACGGYAMRRKAHVHRAKSQNYAEREQTFLFLAESSKESIVTRRELLQLQSRSAKSTNKRPIHDLLTQNPIHHAILRTQEEFVEEQEQLITEQKESIAEQEKSLAEYSAMAAYYSSLKAKYEYAAGRPWLHVPADSPPPSDGYRVEFWLSRGEYEKALVGVDELARRERSPSSEIYNIQAWILATCPEAKFRNGPRAIELATRACKLDGGKDPMYVYTLAAAYAESEDFAAAVHWQQDALSCEPPDSPDRNAMEDRLTLYRQGKPYRDKPTAN